MLKLIILVTALTFGACLATLTPQATSQALTNLNEKMSEMVNALHAASPLSKLKTATETQPSSSSASSGSSTLTYPYYQFPSMSLPQLVYMPSLPAVSPPATKVLEAGMQPLDYAYPVISNPVPRSVMPPMPYSYPTFYPIAQPWEYPQLPYAQGFMPPPPLAMPIPAYPPYPPKQLYSFVPSPYPVMPLVECGPRPAEFVPR